MSKILETAIYVKIYNFQDKKEYFCCDQPRFKSRHSTAYAVLETTEKRRYAEEKISVLLYFCESM